MAILRFLKMVAICHLGFVGHILGPPTMSTWSLSWANFGSNTFSSFYNMEV